LRSWSSTATSTSANAARRTASFSGDVFEFLDFPRVERLSRGRPGEVGCRTYPEAKDESSGSRPGCSRWSARWRRQRLLTVETTFEQRVPVVPATLGASELGACVA
jgi:hypothetical protein